MASPSKHTQPCHVRKAKKGVRRQRRKMGTAKGVGDSVCYPRVVWHPPNIYQRGG